MKKLLILLAVSFSSISSADDVGVQLIAAPDIRKAANPALTEGIESSSYGAIYFPDKILGAKLDGLDGDGADLFNSWSQSHRFIVIPFGISVRPTADRIPENVDVVVAFDNLGDLTRQPIINDVFPPNGFQKAPFEGNAGLKVSGKGEFQPADGVSAGADATIEFSYKYAPAYANVVSGFGSANAFWKYSRTQDSYPIGNIPMRLLIIVPNSYDENEMLAHFDVKVDLGGGFFSSASVAASFSSIVVLPED